MESKKYYVYEWYIVDTGEIFYVGKGCGRRYKIKDRNSIFKDIISQYTCDVRIIKYFDNEGDAFKYEAERIDQLKKLNQCAANINIGGAGGSSEYWTDALRESYSKNNVMKRPEQRERMSKNNPMKNHETALKTNSQKRVPVIINNVEYESIDAAHKATGYSKETIINWCEYGEYPDNISCQYKDESHQAKGNKKFKPFTYKGNHYNNYNDFYNATGIKRTTLKNWLRKGFDKDGNICRRDDDDRDLVYSLNKSMKPIIVNGVYYKSIRQAEKSNDLPKGYISRILNNNKFDPNYICAYDNQQPSQGNTDKNTLEGSTTNE